MYKITNVSRHLMLTGLYPGESKNVESIDNELKLLYDKQLIAITKMTSLQNKKEKTVKVDKKTSDDSTENEEKTKNLKDCEVDDTNGGN